MRIGKPLMIGVTVVGVTGGLIEAWRLTGGLVVLVLLFLTLLGTAFATVVFTIRREQRAEAERRALEHRELEHKTESAQ